MRPSGLHYFPLAWPFTLALVAGLVIVAALVELKLLGYAYQRIGISPRYVFAILFLSIAGSAVNIPVALLPPEPMAAGGWVNSNGVRYVVPGVHEWPGTVLAVNVGGALTPAILSVYLLLRNKLYLRSAVAIAVVAIVTHLLASPVRGVGIAIPIFVPPAAAALTGLIFGWRQAAPLAYIAGTMGTLIGADLLNLDKLQGLGAPVASIGGAGTFDGVFVTGILAVLLTPVALPAFARRG
jgi:uncharacterized membrane protein